MRAQHGAVQKPGPVPKPLGERFWAKVERGGPDECWEWLAYRQQGYGIFNTAGPSGRSRKAHRVAYELTIGPIPDNLTIDHLCRNRGCVNPAHLEPVTLRENILRGDGTAARHARATHCPSGHPYDEANTYRPPNGRRRECWTCKLRRRREAAGRG